MNHDLPSLIPPRPSVDGPTKKGLILLVEDEVTQRLLYRLCLETAGFQVLDLRSGEEALKVLTYCRPQAVCLDFNLPSMNGLEIAERIRRLHADTPVFLLSASEDSDALSRIRSAQDIDGHLSKSTNMTELIRQIESLILRASRQRHLA